MHKFANPARFNRLANAILPWATGVMVIAFTYGLYLIFTNSYVDAKQGETIAIIYIHVPAAMLSMGAYASIAIASFVYLVWRHPLATIAGRAMAPIGAGLTSLALITGMLWGEPMWGTYWVWDARLTGMLVLLFLYIGYMALWSAMDDVEKAARATAIVALVGAVNLPIIKYSVEWWNTLHQPASSLLGSNPNIHPDLQTPLWVMIIAFQAYFAVMTLVGMKMELNRRKIIALKSARMHSTGGQ